MERSGRVGQDTRNNSWNRRSNGYDFRQRSTCSYFPLSHEYTSSQPCPRGTTRRHCSSGSGCRLCHWQLLLLRLLAHHSGFFPFHYPLNFHFNFDNFSTILLLLHLYFFIHSYIGKIFAYS